MNSNFWIAFVMGFSLGCASMIWVMGIFNLRGEIAVFITQKYFKARNWFHGKWWLFQAKYLRWRVK